MTAVAPAPGKEATPAGRPPKPWIRILIGIVALIWAMYTAYQMTTGPTRGQLREALTAQTAFTFALREDVSGIFESNTQSLTALKGIVQQITQLNTTDDKAKFALLAQVNGYIRQVQTDNQALGGVVQKFGDTSYEKFLQPSYSMSFVGTAEAAGKKPPPKQSWITIPGNIMWVSIGLSVLAWLYYAWINAFATDNKSKESARQNMDKLVGFWIGLGASNGINHL